MTTSPGRSPQHLAFLCLAILLVACQPPAPEDSTFVLTVIGTNDVHGVLVPEPGRGGLTTLSGYINAVRAARAADGGEVLVIDAGDMWQGMLASNLSEGATIVEAYNAIGYTAAAVGNHEFDFGPVGPATTPRSDEDDPRGNLRARSAEMQFPLLSANVVIESTGERPDWEHISPSTLIDVQGVRIGIIGVMTERALVTTIAANVHGLAMLPLVETISTEATRLRENGAQIVVVTAHAGSRCTEFDDPYDLSSCRTSGEIMRVADALPAGLVDHIVAGHTHDPIAHIVNETSITSSIARTMTFSRTDFVVDRDSGDIVSRTVFPPQTPCPWLDPEDGSCAWESGNGVVRPVYEGHEVVPDPAVVEVAGRALAFAEAMQSEALGPVLETPITLDGNPESPLGNLFVDAVLAESGADVSIHNVTGGIRATLPAGTLTFGDVYEIMPFDNILVMLDVSGRELREVVAAQAHNHYRRAGISGMRVVASCDAGRLDVTMTLNDGRVVNDSDRVRIAVNDFLATGGDDILTPIIPEEGLDYADDQPLVRDLLVQWFENAGPTLNAEQFLSGGERRWNLPDDLPSNCALPEIP